MAQAITLMNLMIHCDACGHEFPGKIEEWHHKECQKCGVPEIVDDEDVAQYRGLMGLVGLVNGLLGDLPEGHAATFGFDSAATKSANTNSATR